VTTVAFLDASVLYPATIRSVLMYLAVSGVFRARWSAAVQDEWIAALLRERPDIDPQRLARTRLLMDTRIPDAVVSGYEGLVASLSLPDADDRHVLAAAIHGGANIIVTANIRHFPSDALSSHKIAAQVPDDFIRGLLEANPQSAVAAFAADRARLCNPAMTPADYIASLERAGLVQTATGLYAYVDAL
jgi:hypothetical protein